ncbi:MAG TPA: hypothetical protein VHP35_12790, partial [Terriglobia bacterium]|nr:hypothetical protein [Terriglobia bacterium]
GPNGPAALSHLEPAGGQVQVVTNSGSQRATIPFGRGEECIGRGPSRNKTIVVVRKEGHSLSTLGLLSRRKI